MWAILVKKGNRDDTWVKGYENAEAAKKALPEIKEQYGLEPKYYVISCKDPILPTGRHQNRKYTYCPYCGAWRKFVKRGRYTRCPICEITLNDFFVQKFNKAEFLLEHLKALEAANTQENPVVVEQPKTKAN